MDFHYDVIVVGGGHAGAEAAAAAATLGAATCLITMDMNKICQMSCNPAVGGIAKGQIVREIDALGGRMALVADSTALQFRMLNRSKGPAVWSPRAQCDRTRFIAEWRTLLDAIPCLDLWQDEVEELLVDSEKRVTGVQTLYGATFHAPCVVITAGTFLNGMMHIGRRQIAGGRCAERAAESLTASITRHGIRAARMKTGTPPRLDRRTIHFEDTTRQDGDSGTAAQQFSFLSVPRTLPQLPCWTLYTTAACHDILRAALPDSPLYNGQITSIGPRYCPSIETKLVTFADKEQHLLFLEPEGSNTNEMYLNGFSSSMPMEIQLAALHQIPALRDVKMYRPGYAIEYDYFDPTQLTHALESKIVKGLFFAGQVNGTTGYEEAAGQGLVAGVNAAKKSGGSSDRLHLQRDEAYIGVLIDDLVTKGVDEPYRMFTSRAEYRILLRQDNADARLTEKGYNIGLATTQRMQQWKEKEEAIQHLLSFCHTTAMKPHEISALVAKNGGNTQQVKGAKIAELIGRPQVAMDDVVALCPALREQIALLPPHNSRQVAEQVEIILKYKGYIARERTIAEKMRKLEDIKIKGRFDYPTIREISTEGRQKLQRINPETLAQASRIPGVSPSDINVLLVLLNR